MVACERYGFMHLNGKCLLLFDNFRNSLAIEAGSFGLNIK